MKKVQTVPQQQKRKKNRFFSKALLFRRQVRRRLVSNLTRRGIIKSSRFKVFKKRAGWLPRDQWLRRKHFQYQLAMLRRERWLLKQRLWLRRNKRPFWKRKSFKRLRAEQNIIGRMFMVVKKQHGSASLFDRKSWSKKVMAKRYFRSNTIRRDFKTRIVLRHYWKYRYGYYTHNKLQDFLMSVKKKAHRLFYFFSKFELVLYRYARWWGLIPSFCDDRLAQAFIRSGYVYVNFQSEINPFYHIQKNDCIFTVAQPRATGTYVFFPRYATLYGHVKFHSGRREFKKLRKRVQAPVRVRMLRGKRFRRRRFSDSWVQDQYGNSDLFYLKLRTLLQVSTWAPKNLMHYFLLLEISYKIKFLVSITGYNWFSIAFGAVRAYFDVNFILANKFVSMSYY